MKIIDVSAFYKTVVETEVALSPFSTLLWANFSDEGQLFTYDSEGVVRAFSFAMGQNWIPVLDLKGKNEISPEKFRIVSITGNEILSVVLYNKTSPDETDKNKIQTFKFSIPFLVSR